MARIARLVVPHYPHHVTQRGNRRQRVFFGEEDYRTYLDLVGSACARTGTAILAYCLMPNHVHWILVPAREDGLRDAIAEAHRRYTRRVNFREGWRGHLWQERFYSVVMDETHLAAALPYVERNPARAGLCRRAEAWPWTSARARGTGARPCLGRPRSAGRRGLTSRTAALRRARWQWAVRRHGRSHTTAHTNRTTAGWG